MAVLIGYLLVVLIWATTPLAIQWSNESLSFASAVLARMSLALVLALVGNFLLGRTLFGRPGVWRVYLAAALGIFPNMPLVYWSAQFIPSGLIAIVFAMSPFMTGVMTWLILRENPFSRRRLLALLLAVIGLVIIFQQQLQLDVQSAYGVAGIFGSSIVFSLSSVWLKSLDTKVPAFEQTTGALLFAMPGLILVWWLVDASLPNTVSVKSFGAVVYLAVMGSLAGFTLFFYILQKMSPSAVSLITLVTPVLALLLGATVAGETISFSVIIGTALVLLALLFYVDWSFGHWFEHSLQRPAQSEQSLSDLKSTFIHYK